MHATPGSRALPVSGRGFTLIELLVVLAILAMLFALVTLGVNKFIARGESAKSESTLSMIKGYLETYRQDTGDYPPCSLAKLGVRAPNALNEGSEAMVLALCAKDYSGELIDDRYLANVDDDKTDKNISKFGEPKLVEVQDAWGNPIAYFRYDAYDVAQEYEIMDAATQQRSRVQIRAAKNPLTGSYFAPESYQLVSAGEDGVFGTQDDVKSYDDR